jgi:anti-anti-sigma factor
LFRFAAKAYNCNVMELGPAASPNHIVRLTGEYDLTRRDELAAIFSKLDGDGEIVIDMGDVTYVDSTVLRELAALRLRDQERSVFLRGVRAPIRHILSIVGFDRIFTIV